MEKRTSYGQQLGAPLQIYGARYEKLDTSEVTARTGAPFDPARSAFMLTVLGHRLYAAWPLFALSPDDPEACPRALYEGEALILMIRYLLEGTRAAPEGGWLPYRELPWGDVYDANFQGRCRARLAFGFGPRLGAFARACGLLGGVPVDGKGDYSCELEFVPGVFVRLILWAGDEEFPPQSQWLFSDNTPLSFSAEDAAAIGDVLIGALKELSGRPA